VPRQTPTSHDSSSASAPAIDLQPNPSAILAVWWIALHALVAAALALLGAPWLLKGLALLVLLVHAIALAPERAGRVVIRRDGRVTLPELGLDDLALGPRTLFTTHWVRLDLRGSGGAFDILLLADQVDPVAWHTLQVELRGFRASAGNARRAK
jgi:hypothetical protein